MLGMPDGNKNPSLIITFKEKFKRPNFMIESKDNKIQKEYRNQIILFLRVNVQIVENQKSIKLISANPSPDF